MLFNRTPAVLKGIVIAGSLIVASSSAVRCQQQDTEEQFLEKVRHAIKNDEWRGAKAGIIHAMALKPDLPEVQFLAAQVYWHEGERSMAMESLNKAIEAQPVYPEAHFLLARYLFDLRRHEEARQQAATAISQGMPGLIAYRLLGEVDYAEGKFEAAALSFEAAARFAQPSEQAEAADLKRESEGLREYIKLVPTIEAQQQAPDVLRPVPLNSPSLAYTDDARKSKIQGTVSMVVLVTEMGDIDSVIVFRGLGHGLNERAIEAARELKFSPATRNGKPIPYWTKVMIEFNLR